MNEEGEISSGEHCFVSDHDIVKKQFCLDHNGRWNPIGEWQMDNVRSRTTKEHTDENFFYFRKPNKFEVTKKSYVWKPMVKI